MSKKNDSSNLGTVGVYVKPGEPIEVALKRFKRDCANAGIMSEVKRREFYEKPSTVKRRKVEAAKRKKDKKRMIYNRRDR